MSLPCRELVGEIGCEAASELLSAWIDGELTDDEAQVLDRHLTGCARSRAEQVRLEEVSVAFRSVTPVAPPPRVRQEVLDRIRRDLGGDRGAAPPRRRPSLRHLIAAVVVLLAAGGASWWMGGWSPVAPEAPEAMAERTLDAFADDLGADAGCGPNGDCLHLAPCDSPAECGGGPPCSDPGECDGGVL